MSSEDGYSRRSFFKFVGAVTAGEAVRSIFGSAKTEARGEKIFFPLAVEVNGPVEVLIPVYEEEDKDRRNFTGSYCRVVKPDLKWLPVYNFLGRRDFHLAERDENGGFSYKGNSYLDGAFEVSEPDSRVLNPHLVSTVQLYRYARGDQKLMDCLEHFYGPGLQDHMKKLGVQLVEKSEKGGVGGAAESEIFVFGDSVDLVNDFLSDKPEHELGFVLKSEGGDIDFGSNYLLTEYYLFSNTPNEYNYLPEIGGLTERGLSVSPLGWSSLKKYLGRDVFISEVWERFVSSKVHPMAVDYYKRNISFLGVPISSAYDEGGGMLRQFFLNGVLVIDINTGVVHQEKLGVDYMRDSLGEEVPAILKEENFGLNFDRWSRDISKELLSGEIDSYDAALVKLWAEDNKIEISKISREKFQELYIYLIGLRSNFAEIKKAFGVIARGQRVIDGFMKSYLSESDFRGGFPDYHMDPDNMMLMPWFAYSGLFGGEFGPEVEPENFPVLVGPFNSVKKIKGDDLANLAWGAFHEGSCHSAWQERSKYKYLLDDWWGTYCAAVHVSMDLVIDMGMQEIKKETGGIDGPHPPHAGVVLFASRVGNWKPLIAELVCCGDRRGLARKAWVLVNKEHDVKIDFFDLFKLSHGEILEKFPDFDYGLELDKLRQQY